MHFPRSVLFCQPHQQLFTQPFCSAELSFVLLYVHRSYIHLIRDWEAGIEWGGYLWIARPFAPTRKDRRDRQPPPGQQCSGGGDTSVKQLVYCTTCYLNSCAEQSQRQKVRRISCWETTQQQDNPSSYEIPAPPSVQLWDPSSTSLLLISPGFCLFSWTVNMVLNVHRTQNAY